MIRQAVESISLQSRNATGVRVQRLDKADAIVAVALVPEAAEEEEDATSVDGETVAVTEEATEAAEEE